MLLHGVAQTTNTHAHHRSPKGTIVINAMVKAESLDFTSNAINIYYNRNKDKLNMLKKIF